MVAYDLTTLYIRNGADKEDNFLFLLSATSYILYVVCNQPDKIETMDFELSETLGELLKQDKLDEAISIAETKLRQHTKTDFNKILGRDINNLSDDFADYIDEFYKKINSRMTVKAIYCEMNGFTINPDLWFVDLFAYDTFGGTEDYDWLADWDQENSSKESFILSGYEDIQTVYESYMKKENWKNDVESTAHGICELLVVLRLQELMKNTFQLGRQKGQQWTTVPVLVTAHDYYDMVYKVE